MTTKYVIVEPINYGRSFRANPGLSFATDEEAEGAIVAKCNEKYRSRFSVESRNVKDVDGSQTMHCQCCGRAIHAALGTIAHHGYRGRVGLADRVVLRCEAVAVGGRSRRGGGSDRASQARC